VPEHIGQHRQRLASFLLKYGLGATGTIRYLRQVYPPGILRAGRLAHQSKAGFQLQAALQFTLPPVSGGDQYSDFSPTTPNPAVNNYPGAHLRGQRTGAAGCAQPDSRILRLGIAAAGAVWSESQATIRAGPAGPTAVSRARVAQPLRRIYRPVCLHPQSGHHPAFNWDRAAPPIHCPRKSTRRSQQATWRTGTGTTPSSGGVRQLDALGAA
jgi:hypothetical protein